MKGPSRVGLVHLGLALFALAIVGKSARVQLLQGRAWAASALRQQSTERVIPAPRGEILDASGGTLAQSRETVKLDVAPPEVKNRRALRDALAAAGVPAPMVARAVDPARKWVQLPGRFVASEVARISAMRGVYTTPIIERAYASSDGLRRIIGRVDADGRAVDGVELALDSLLRGVPGSATVMRDARGRRFESPTAPGTGAGERPHGDAHDQPRAAGDRRARARRRGGADGRRGRRHRRARPGRRRDPRHGEPAADPRATAATALTEPYEPGLHDEAVHRRGAAREGARAGDRRRGHATTGSSRSTAARSTTSTGRRGSASPR